MERLKWGPSARGDGTYFVINRNGHKDEIYSRQRQVAWDYDTAVEVAWAFVLQHYEIYLHKKGGIYRKIKEGPMPEGDHGAANIIVNYEHLWPHERAEAYRFKAEWEAPGRFVRITVND